MRAHAIVISLVVAAIAVGRPAAAQSPRDSDSDAEAKQHFERGQALYAQGQYRDALVEFSAGYDLSHRSLLLFNMAECERLDGDTARARIDYQRYLDADPAGSLATVAKDRIAKLPAAPAPAPPPAAPPPVHVSVATPAIDLDPHHVIRDAPESGQPLASLDLDRDEPQPIYKRWPFWAGVGAGVVVASVIVYAATRSGGPGCDGCEVVDLR